MTSAAAALPHRINGPDDIPAEQVYEGIRRLLDLPDGQTRDVMLGSVLTGLLLRGPRLVEVEAAIRAALALDQACGWEIHQPPTGVRLTGYTGSGKKSFKTFNISTASALVAAAGGARIAKLGSRSASSMTGSRDFMEYVGADCRRLPTAEMAAVAGELGFGFFSIEDRIPEFDHRYGGRFQSVHALSLAFPALLSPIACAGFVYGLAHPAVEASAELLTRLGLPDVTVVNSQLPTGEHADELLGGALVRACRVISGTSDREFAAEVVSSAVSQTQDFQAVAQRNDPLTNVSAALRVLAGFERGGDRDAVVLNAALLLRVSGVVTTFQAGTELARDVVDAGAGIDVLEDFIRTTGGSVTQLNSLLGEIVPA